MQSGITKEHYRRSQTSWKKPCVRCHQAGQIMKGCRYPYRNHGHCKKCSNHYQLLKAKYGITPPWKRGVWNAPNLSTGPEWYQAAKLVTRLRGLRDRQAWNYTPRPNLRKGHQRDYGDIPLAAPCRRLDCRTTKGPPSADRKRYIRIHGYCKSCYQSILWAQKLPTEIPASRPLTCLDLIRIVRAAERRIFGARAQ